MKLTERVVKSLKVPSEGHEITWDTEIKGFGIRVTATGATSFVLSYRIFRRQRMYTIGRFPEWSVAAARNEAIELRAKIRDGVDPMEEKDKLRNEPSFDDLVDDYLKSDEYSRKRLRTQNNYRWMGDKFLRPRWGQMRLKSIQRSDVEALHSAMESTPYAANRVASFASRLFNYAITKKWMEANPAKDLERYHEEKRSRFLNQEDETEISRFNAALDAYSAQDADNASAANALRLLLLTGARSGEVLSARWEHFNLSRGVWTKPSSHTKQKKTEIIPLSEPAVQLLESMKPDGVSVGPLFIGRDGKKSRKGLRRPWLQVLKLAGLVTEIEIPGKRGPLKRYKPSVRLHDLRHTFASHLASNGVSLQIIGKLIGHSVAQTTMRYAHLQDASLRDASNQVGKILSITMAKRA